MPGHMCTDIDTGIGLKGEGEGGLNERLRIIYSFCMKAIRSIRGVVMQEEGALWAATKSLYLLI